MKAKLIALALVLAVVFGAGAQVKELRVLVANHPYGELLKAAIPEYEKATGVKINVESLQESQLTTKLTTEFATNSSSADVFMTRPLQEGKMFYKNGWYEPLSAYDFSDYPDSAMGVAKFGNKPYIVPLVTEWQVLYYRKDLLKKAGLSVPTTFAELENVAKNLDTTEVAGFASRGKGAAAVTQLSSYVYNYGGRYLDKGVAVFDSKEALFKALPEVPKAEIVWRFHFMLGATSYAIAGTDALRLVTDWQIEDEDSTDRLDRLVPRLMSFLLGGLRAPLPQF